VGLVVLAAFGGDAFGAGAAAFGIIAVRSPQ
jgi:hypothetical protein